MRLPDEVQKCVVFFGLKTTDKKTRIERIRYGGTGFFVNVPSSIHGADFTVLVTARHVAEKLQHGEFYIRVNRRDGTAIEYRAEGGIDAVWHFHPNDMSVDAAIAIWSPSYEDDADYLCIPRNMFLDENKIKEKGIGTGDEVYITGLFRLLYGRQRNVPIVRTGSLAMLNSERVPVRDWHTEDVLAYLVEARSIGASSGSPVFVQRSIKVQAVEHSGRVPIAAGACFWLGLVLGHWDERKVQVADDWGDISIEVGLSVVVPCHKILEVLQNEQLVVEMRERELTVEDTFSEVIMDGASPSTVDHGKERLASALLSAPSLTEPASDGPDFHDLTRSRGVKPAHEL